MTIKAPEGYKQRSLDPVGMWDPELSPAIHFIPFGVKLFDSSIDKSKPSCLVLGRLVDGANLRVKNDDEESQVPGKEGDVVGVWYKPGMRALLNLEGRKVWMTEGGEKDVGKPSPMKLFTILSPDSPDSSLITVLDDTRDRSRGVVTPFDKKRTSTQSAKDDSEIPF